MAKEARPQVGQPRQDRRSSYRLQLKRIVAIYSPNLPHALAAIAGAFRSSVVSLSVPRRTVRACGGCGQNGRPTSLRE